MRTTFVQPAAFRQNWSRLKLTDADLQVLAQIILHDRAAGDVIPGTGGLRKLRFAPPSWNVGKSGATRVCYVDFLGGTVTYLLAIYPKNKKENLTPLEKHSYKQLIAIIDAALKKRRGHL